MTGAAVQERRLLVHGRVQGVGFRWWTRTQAERLGVTGTVRNREDGTVEVTARGSASVLARFVELLHHGPPGAEVQRVEELPAIPIPSAGFQITR